ncbi:MAG TPA: cyclic-phosphate processing receiver domain-containing protein [Pyrinomonadaceae bacterium]|nr:cyclic-phosphate processing receiver domain-containing protein [Pyrinomonadaceae bacterium]
MSILEGLLRKLGLRDASARPALSVFLLDDDTARHRWFAKRFKNDHLDVAVEPSSAIEYLQTNLYDAIFLDHDLLPEHYHAEVLEDKLTGYEVAEWLASHPERQSSSTIIVHTRNADGAWKMVRKLQDAGRHAEYVPFPVLSPRLKQYWQR